MFIEQGVDVEETFRHIHELYNYGVEITHPVGYEHVTSTSISPYSVQFGEYNRTVSNLHYWLYFFDKDNNLAIGETYNIYGSPYSFDGSLIDGSLSQNAYWYLGATYQENGYKIYINSFGTFVYYGAGSTSLTQHGQAVQETLKPVSQ